jgi:hypothetical protein
MVLPNIYKFFFSPAYFFVSIKERYFVHFVEACWRGGDGEVNIMNSATLTAAERLV